MKDDKLIAEQPELYANHEKIAAALQRWAKEVEEMPTKRQDYVNALEEVAAQLRNGLWLEGGRNLVPPSGEVEERRLL